MKITEFVVEKLSIWGVEYSDKLIVAEMQKVGLSENEDYTEATSGKVDLIFYNIIPDLMMMPNSVSEGGYSISYDKKALANFYGQLSKKLGKVNQLTEANNQIKDITHLW